MEILIDYSYFFDYGTTPKEFFGIHNQLQDNNGVIHELSLVDYSCLSTEPLEIISEETPIEIEHQYNWLSILYDVLPAEIETDLTIVNSTRAVHCDVEVVGFNTEFTLGDRSTLELYDGNLTISQYCTLSLAGNATIKAVQGNNKLTIEGALNNQSPNVSVIVDAGAALVIEFNNLGGIYSISDMNIFGADIHARCSSLTINNNCILDDVIIDFSYGDLNVSGIINATNTFIKAAFPESSNSQINISNNQITNGLIPGDAVITIDDYSNVLIQYNSIIYNYGNGIDLYYAGNESSAGVQVINNVIDKNSGLPNNNKGVNLYFSKALLQNNIIRNNTFGVYGFHRSSIEVKGNENALDYSETQQLINNQINGIFSSSSFPAYFHYNLISKDFNDTEPYIAVVPWDLNQQDTTYRDFSEFVDPYNVEYNCWGNYFDPYTHLYPEEEFFDYDPVWCPGQTHNIVQNIADSLYSTATDALYNENYLLADSIYNILVSDYYMYDKSIAALKAKYGLESLNQNDFLSLKIFYDSVIFSNNNSYLVKNANWLASHCNIKLANYQDAVDSLENKIIYPQSTYDSTCAVIDLGYLYTHLGEDSLRSSIVSKYPELMPDNFNAYRNSRSKSLEKISNIFIRNANYAIDHPINVNGQIPVSILKVRPIPSDESIKVDYYVEKDGYIRIEVYSVLGHLEFYEELGMKSMGNYNYIKSLNNFANGLYYLIIKYNGSNSCMKKFIKI